jgi:flagellar basal-body rod protein FlgB
MNAALDAYALRQKTIAKNVANINTPGYIPERVRFEEEFHKQQEVLRGSETNNFHQSLGDKSRLDVQSEAYKSVVPEAEVYQSGDNSVNIDTEMSEMAQNQIRTRFASQMLSRYFKGLNSAITGQATQG